MFVKGQEYKRQELHYKYGGQVQGGISTPRGQPFILLFTSEQGEQFGYKDGWSSNGAFFYTGEGQEGDMELVRGNKAIVTHADTGKDLHLFQQTRKGYVRYVGQMVCKGYHWRQGADVRGKQRQIVVFELSPAES
ncbi:MAG: HNH endonuclease [Chloroflexi bacterium]|nr:HNH endonuclease [Chloroflexota bacterium]